MVLFLQFVPVTPLRASCSLTGKAHVLSSHIELYHTVLVGKVGCQSVLKWLVVFACNEEHHTASWLQHTAVQFSRTHRSLGAHPLACTSASHHLLPLQFVCSWCSEAHVQAERRNLGCNISSTSAVVQYHVAVKQPSLQANLPAT